MKALRVLLIIVLVIAVIGGILTFTAATDYTMERSTIINAPQELVYEQVSKFNNFHEWSPWSKLDPDQEWNIEGEDGTVGAVYTWSGDENVGIGSQTVKEMDPNNSINFNLEFQMEEGGMKMEYMAGFDVASVEEGTQVTWKFNTHVARPFNIFMLFSPSFETTLGPNYEAGLANLKARCEEMASDPQKKMNSNYIINEIDLPAMNYVGVRATIGWNDMKAFFETNMSKAFVAMGPAGMQPATPAAGVFFKWDEENQQTDLMVGCGHSGDNKLDGFDSYAYAGGKALSIDYYGPYEGTEGPHMQLGAYMEENGLELDGIVMEYYVTDPGEEPDTTKWLTQVIYPIKAADETAKK